MARNPNIFETVREDDFVEYYVFLSSVTKADEVEKNVQLKDLEKQVNCVVEKYSSNYLWHRDKLNFVVKSGLDVSYPPHLYGVSHYGENIEDEWFMVYLLVQITKEINGSIVRVVDSDGEFLLIETAEYLPNWANPDNCANKVFVYQGLIHIVPPNKKLTQVQDILSEIVSNPNATGASAEVQNCIKKKLLGYPDKMKENLHRATVYVPKGVAAILKHKPQLIAAVVQSFCNRNSIDMKACRAMRYFPPEDRVYTSILFTKCLYAMLIHSKFSPDRRTGWGLPSVTSPQYKAHILGVRIASGFEILISQARQDCGNIEGDKEWQAYLKKLQETNYFRDTLPHSKPHSELLKEAKEYYTNHCSATSHVPIPTGKEIHDLYRTLNLDAEELQTCQEDLPPEDDDSWLNIDEKELDNMLQEKYGNSSTFKFNENSNVQSFSEKVAEFLNHVSDVEGVEFPKIHVPLNSTNPPENANPNGNKVAFEPHQFSCAVQNILDYMIPEDDTWDLESGSDMSDYGEDADVNLEGCEAVKNDMQKYMEQMDKELASKCAFQDKASASDGFEDVEAFKPVDIDMNALKNVLMSYQAQMGESGPASNMLGPMGVRLEKDSNLTSQFKTPD